MGTKIQVRREAFEELSVRNIEQILEDATLEECEHILMLAEAAGFESFVLKGLSLKVIRDKRKYRDEFKTWDNYCKSGRAHGYTRRTADKIIAAANVRPFLPNLGPSGAQNGNDAQWTEKFVRPLTNEKLAVPDVRRLGKKIAMRIKKGEHLTYKLVKSLVDEELGVERKKKKKIKQNLEQASLESNLKLAVEIVLGLTQGLEVYYSDDWNEVQRTKPHLIKSLITVVDELASFLKEEDYV